MGNDNLDPNYIVPQWNPPCPWRVGVRTLVVLDDVWSLPVLERLIFKNPGCKTLVVSRIKFPTTILNATFEVELLSENDALSLFCYSAFGQKSIPPAANENLVKQVMFNCFLCVCVYIYIYMYMYIYFCLLVLPLISDCEGV